VDNPDNLIIEYLGVYVDGEGGGKSKPRIIIDQYDFGGEYILAGQEFDLKITFFNTSSSIGIQNAKVTLNVLEDAFVPVNAASSFFVEKIGAKEKISRTIRMKAKTDLLVKSYTVTADIEYEDSNGNSYDINKNPYKATESISIPVIQEIRLEIENVIVPEINFIDRSFELTVEFFNMGRSVLSNMMVTTEGDFTISDGKFFVGNFQQGSNEYYSCDITPTNSGTNEGKVIFNFEDAVGTKHTVEKTFSFNATIEKNDFKDNSGGSQEDEQSHLAQEGKESFLRIIVILGLFLILTVVIIQVIIFRKKKRKKEEMELDD